MQAEGGSIFSSFNWGAVLTVVVMLWSIGILALVERLRRTFATPKELDNLKGELCRLIERLEDKIEQYESKLEAWEHASDKRYATRDELNGWGARVGNLEEMYRGTATLAQAASDASKDAQRELKHLSSEVNKSLGKIDESIRKAEGISIQFAEMRVELRHLITGLQLKKSNP